MLFFQVENIAMFKFATMSSQYARSKPSYGVDGYTTHPIVHTATNLLPAWYYVDLGETARVKHIRILNRYDYCEITDFIQIELWNTFIKMIMSC